ncbi:MAG: bifunctional nicotinamidase/pyrazinamidase [Spirochaetes bacterium]|nr:bifunctional nicotinamidase/pyrazinamidase [Spirochaetota bacterium]
MKEKKNALLIVDVQNDFCPGGKLAVKDGHKVIPIIESISHKFFKRIATQDWHPRDHISFAVNHRDKKEYDLIEAPYGKQVLWPVHCVAGTKGADFHPDLDRKNIDLIIRKGTDRMIDSYSTFMENDKHTPTGLEGYLKTLGISRVFLTGLATDYCVLFSSLDAKAKGFEAFVIIDACRGVNVPEKNIEKALDLMKKNGIHIIESSGLKP